MGGQFAPESGGQFDRILHDSKAQAYIKKEAIKNLKTNSR